MLDNNTNDCHLIRDGCVASGMVVRRKTIMSWVLALHSVVAHGEILHLASFEPEVHVYVYIMYMNINSRIASSEVVIPEKRLF